MPQDNTYFELKYQGPWKGINDSMPENLLQPSETPSSFNFILKDGELRTRPRETYVMPGPSDGSNVDSVSSFMDSNNIVHTVIVTSSGLWQLNASWRKDNRQAWSKVGTYTVQPGPQIPVASVTLVNTFYWTNGGTNLWSWNGITSAGAGSPNPFTNVATVDTVNHITAGAYYLGTLNAQLIMLNTVEGPSTTPGEASNFTQRIRWSPSGLPNVWDPNVNIGAGFNDELDVPDMITGFMTIGRSGFIFRTNGITEITSIGSAENPFDFNHLWAGDNGIGNVYPFSIASYGPVGMFISVDDVYNLTLNGFKRVGNNARNSIMNDLSIAIGSPIATILPRFNKGYVYPIYRLMIPLAVGTKVWNYSIEDDSWQPSFKAGYYIGKPNFVVVA